MGCTTSINRVNPSAVPLSDDASTDRSRKWRPTSNLEEKQKKFQEDGSLSKKKKVSEINEGHIECRDILDDPIGQRYVGQFAKSNFTHEHFFCWIDMQEFKAIPTKDYRRSKAMHIYDKYLKVGAVLELGSVAPQEKERFKGIVERARGDKSVVTPNMFDDIWQMVFVDIYHNTFIPFKRSDKYEEYRKEIRETYNKVSVDDFEYMEKLGEGGFGRVVHCRKISTGKHYAMKIQLKTALLDTFWDDPTRLDAEKSVFAACHHPFIVSLDYAFQTPSHAILALGLVTAGDLQEIMEKEPSKRLDEDRVVLYTAEVVLALQHLHELGLMYRDLKPCNVLLGADGHVQLADMGGVADFKGNVLDHRNEKADDDGVYRRRSIMGTRGYMAPEVLDLMSAVSARKGYTQAVDFWSLGVTVYKLLCGTRPFDMSSYDVLLEYSSEQKQQKQAEYDNLLHRIYFPTFISDAGCELIIGLMALHPEDRLGSNAEGVDGLTQHAFFNGMDFIKLGQKHLDAAYKPDVQLPSEKPMYPSYSTMMEAITGPDDRSNFDWESVPSDRQQRHFDEWDFVSPHTLKVEMGIAGEMAVHDTNLKVQQILGADDRPRNNRAGASKSIQDTIMGSLSQLANSQGQGR
uniref:Protein kinase domain-containing protein n=1 Tax=Phaeomonas parva TaxID=124430 RepID=A0A7S1U415_9STRA|mmetsp:Transcript_303/g.781  ORF Transcript_303/g.781 Transcript_303/m.781 type:complete len:630 (+) Transcript_303:213-2102(+)